MAKNRIISLINILDGIVVQSYQFKKYLPIGKPKIAIDYMNNWGIDEIILLDIKNSLSKKNYLIKNLKSITKNCQTPVSAGGGIVNIKQVEKMIRNGADKVVINSSSYQNKNLIKESVKEFGSQAVVSAIDVKKDKKKYYLFSKSGLKKEKINIKDHLKNLQEYGAGEILINSINMDGSQEGYDYEFLKIYKELIQIPIIISGGYGNVNHIASLSKYNISGFAIGNSLHHFEHSVQLIKKKLSEIYKKNNIRFEKNYSYKLHEVNFKGRLKV